MYTISVEDLLSLENPFIVDIRNIYYYNIDHIAGAINIPYYNLLNNYSHYLDKNNKYYFYCDFGEKSSELANRLNKFGYNIISVDGGYLEYKKIIRK